MGCIFDCCRKRQKTDKTDKVEPPIVPGAPGVSDTYIAPPPLLPPPPYNVNALAK